MNRSVLDCLVTGYEHLIPAITLPDENDRHVVAAAIHAKADEIVTYNLKDFPGAEMRKYNLAAIHPDEFINYQFDLRQEAEVVVAAQQCRARLRKPPVSAEDYLNKLEQLRLAKTVAALRPFSSVI